MQHHVHTLIQPKYILTVNSKNDVLTDHTLVLDCGKIIDIVPNLQLSKKYTANNMYRLPNHLICPGFINTHTHSPMVLMRGLADDLELDDWLNNHIWPAEAKVISEKFIQDGFELAMAQMIQSGTTFFNDHYFHMESVLPLIEKTGMRAQLAECLFEFETPWMPNFEVGIERTRDLKKACEKYNLIKPAIGPHSPYATTQKMMELIGDLSEQLDLPIHIHLHETQKEVNDYKIKHSNLTPLGHFHNMGLTGQKLIAVHMSHLSPTDFEILKATKTQVIHCPESNMKLASGQCPTQRLIDSRVNVALGTDGAASNNDLDMLGEMRSAALLGKITANNPKAISAETALKMATINGAKALQMDEVTGSIEIGKSADITAIEINNLNNLNNLPCYNPISHLVYSASKSDISHVWINGKIVLKDFSLTTIDINNLRERINQWTEKLK